MSLKQQKKSSDIELDGVKIVDGIIIEETRAASSIENPSDPPESGQSFQAGEKSNPEKATDNPGSRGNNPKEKKPASSNPRESSYKDPDDINIVPEEPEKIEKKRGRPHSIDDFFTALRAAGRSEFTVRGYMSNLRFWKKVEGKYKRSIYNLKVKEIEKEIAGMDINTAKRHVAALRSLAKWYLRDGYPALHVELQKLMMGKGKARIAKAKSEDEYRDIREEAKKLCKEGNRRGIWLGLMLCCGLRISEIQTAVPGKNWVQVRGKGNRERRIPCPTWLVKAMHKSEGTGRGGYMKKRQVIDRDLRKHGYDKCHSLRHSYATVLLHKGVSIDIIQRLLGHASIATTQVYTKTKIPEGINDIVESV